MRPMGSVQIVVEDSPLSVECDRLRESEQHLDCVLIELRKLCVKQGHSA